MNEHQNDFNLDNSISQQHQISEIATGYDPKHISIEPPQSDYVNQPNYESDNPLNNGFNDDTNLSFEQTNLSDNLSTNNFEPDYISYAPDVTSFPEQNSQLIEQHSFPDLHHQEMYSASTNMEELYGSSTSEIMNSGGIAFNHADSSIVGFEDPNSFNASLNNDTSNNQFPEQPFEHHTDSFNPDSNYNQQRTGREPTADELKQANDIVHQAEQAHKDYENAMAWGKHYDQQSSYDKAAEYKQKEEELRAKADKLRNPS